MLEHKLRLVAAAARRVGVGTDAATLRDLAGEIEWAKACLVAPEDYLGAVAAARRDTPVPAAQVAKVYADYESIKAESRQLDFDDLLLHVCGILENDEDCARTFRAQYRCFVVDEYQDVTPLQQRTLDAWLGGRDQITVVGDANQTIYSFAGASPQYLLGFDRRYPHAAVVRLERDYRSTPQVVSVANRVIAGAGGALTRIRLRLTAVLPDGPEVGYAEHADEPAEAAAVAQRISALITGGMPAASIAILYRINAQSEAYEQALATAGVRVRGSWRRALLRPARGARGAHRVAVRGGSRRWVDLRDGAPTSSGDPADRAGANDEDGTGNGTAAARPENVLVPAVRGILGPVGLSETPPPAGALRDRWESLAALVSAAADLAAADRSADLAAFVAELDQRAEAQHAPTVDGVTLASLHAAKGLEWEAVFLVGLVDGTLPIQHAQTPDEIEEERRLLYVGRDEGTDPARVVMGAVPAAGRPPVSATQPVPHRARPG